MSESLLDDLRVACSKAGLSDNIAEHVYEDIGALVDAKHIVAHHVVPGPPPDFPATQVDVFILTETSVYNYSVPAQGNGWWAITPLAKVSHLSEVPGQGASERWVSLWMFDDTGSSLVIQDQKERWTGARSFLYKLLQRI